ncbi:MAG: D-alanyl-D-alanine carboxypeptidase family protein [Myxococcales bacterium]|nr:D-alanyl-D-alanine carboxypeptidase family protein [Myxococcales bacterium]
MTSSILMWENQHRFDPGAKEGIMLLQAALGLAADGAYGKGTAGAVSDWQEENGFEVTGFVDAKMCEALGVPCPFVEKRVRLDRYGAMREDSSLMVLGPSTSSRVVKLHRLAAEGMKRLAAEVQAELGIELKLTSGWRPSEWTSREQYEQEMIKRYGSVEEGRKFMAFASPHETGLAMDIGVGGLEPKRATIPQQEKTELYLWLVKNAWRTGWHPYKREPWHWEYPIGYREWETGEAGVDRWQPQKGVHFDASEEDLYVEVPSDEDLG